MANDEELINQKKGEDVPLDEVSKKLDNISLQVDDEIDLKDYTYRENFAVDSNLRGEQTVIPVRRPDPQSWIYISSRPELRTTVAILELKQQREVFLVKQEIATSLDGDVSNRLLVPYQDREGGLFLWAVKLSDSRGNLDSWTTSALRIVTEYCDRWIKIKSRMNAGCYEVIPAPIESPAPEWPAAGLQFLVNRAFKNKLITSVQDPVIKRLKGLM